VLLSLVYQNPVVGTGKMRRNEWGGGTLVPESFCILPGPDREGDYIGSDIIGLFDDVAMFVFSVVYGSSRFTDVHEEIFAV
jgi:hypothetical protein